MAEETSETWNRVVVPPRTWFAARVLGDAATDDTPDTRTVVEIFHDNTGSIELLVADDGCTAFAGEPEDYPADGWRARLMPWVDSLGARVDAATEIQPAEEPNALAGHPMNDTAVRATEQSVADAGHATEAIVAMLLADGFVERVGQDEAGHDRYQLTEAGQELGREILGRLGDEVNARGSE